MQVQNITSLNTSDVNGIEINYNQQVIAQSVYLFDNENAITETKIIGEQTVNIISNKYTFQIYWFDDIHFYTIVGVIDINELLKMVESIIMKVICNNLKINIIKRPLCSLRRY